MSDEHDDSGPPAADPGEPPSAAQSPPLRLPFPVAGIGASAGGLEALEALTHQLVPDRMAFVVVQHLAPGHVSMLTEILKRGTTLRVLTIENGMRLEAGVIYVAPPTVEVTLDGDRLRLAPQEDGAGVRRNVDVFLCSLARTGGPMAIGIVLSGSGSDGTVGLKAIKDEGGITFVQEPSSAAQPSMPQTAADAGHADFALIPEEIGLELRRLSAHPYVGRARTDKLVDHDSSAKIFAQLRAAFGVDFTQYKQSTVERRIGRRMALHKIEQTEEYLKVLAADIGELRSLYNDLLIGVTSFFRDAEPFDALKQIVFPRLFDNRPVESPVRIWIAGCSTGEEAFSVAMALLEFLDDRAGAFTIQIFATDVDENALARARAAVYPPTIERDLSPGRLQRFFVRNDRGYQVSRQVRDLVVFARHNLGKDPPFSRLDLVTCRNVLIYLQGPLQKKVLRIFHYSLKPDAYLVLGTSESVGDAVDLFSLIDRKLKVYVKKNIPLTAPFDVSFTSGRGANDTEVAVAPSDLRPILGVAQIADRKVLERYAPPGVIVDERLDVVQFRGRIGPFLEPAPGAATLNLLKLARPELLVALRATMHKVLADGLATTSPPVPLWGDGKAQSVVIDVVPLVDTLGRKAVLVLFTDQGVPAVAPDEGSGAAPRLTDDPRLGELERELATTKEYLQSTIEELEAANEELQSSNEELQSSNEELQSTNEELETSKEELQSTNEELATVNDELHNRMGQLSVANDDLQNVLLNSHGAIVIVGADFRIPPLLDGGGEAPQPHPGRHRKALGVSAKRRQRARRRAARRGGHRLGRRARAARPLPRRLLVRDEDGAVRHRRSGDPRARHRVRADGHAGGDPGRATRRPGHGAGPVGAPPPAHPRRPAAQPRLGEPRRVRGLRRRPGRARETARGGLRQPHRPPGALGVPRRAREGQRPARHPRRSPVRAARPASDALHGPRRAPRVGAGVPGDGVHARRVTSGVASPTSRRTPAR